MGGRYVGRLAPTYDALYWRRHRVSTGLADGQRPRPGESTVVAGVGHATVAGGEGPREQTSKMALDGIRGHRMWARSIWAARYGSNGTTPLRRCRVREPGCFYRAG